MASSSSSSSSSQTESCWPWGGGLTLRYLLEPLLPLMCLRVCEGQTRGEEVPESGPAIHPGHMVSRHSALPSHLSTYCDFQFSFPGPHESTLPHTNTHTRAHASGELTHKHAAHDRSGPPLTLNCWPLMVLWTRSRVGEGGGGCAFVRACRACDSRGKKCEWLSSYLFKGAFL